MTKNESQASFNAAVVFKIVCLAVVMVLFSGTLAAATIDLPFAEIAQSADLIFIGTVESRQSRLNDQQTFILTDVVFSDVAIVHGNERALQRDHSVITLTHAGGCVGNLCLDVSIAPTFVEGKRYLLFVSDDGKAYANPVIGGAQGLFEVVRDVQSGREYVLTAGRRCVLGAEAQGLVKSKRPVSYIRDGLPVYDLSRESSIGPMFNQAPTPANPWDGAAVSFAESVQETGPAQPLALTDFIAYIKEVALGVELEKRLLKREGEGYFMQRRGARIERRPLTHLVPEASKIELLDDEDLQRQIVPLAADDRLPDAPQGGQLGWCGYHSLPFKMESVPSDWWSYDTIQSAMNLWNKFMEVYQKRASDGKFGHNSENEFCGWVKDETMFKIYGVHWNSYLAWAHHWWWSGKPCGRLLESDILFNPSYDWTDDANFALGNDAVILLRPVVMHELAHTWGMQRGEEGQWGYHETYDYDHPTVVHSYYYNIVEDGRGIHRADAYCFRRDYDNQTSIKKSFVDVGVESYYADDGLHNATTNAASYYPGGAISFNNITVENNSYKDVSDVRIRIFLSSDRNITTGDYKVGSYWYWDNFEAESYAVVDLDSNIPADIPPGTYYIGLIVTINGYEQDDYTSNNKTSFYVTITIKSKSNGNNGNGDGGKKCFIATAVFGSASHAQVTILRNFRDKYLAQSRLGRQLIAAYYRYSPPLADFISKHEALKAAVKGGLSPLVALCSTILHLDSLLPILCLGD